MGNSKNISSKVLYDTNNEIKDSFSKLSTKSPKTDHVFLQKSVTLLALKQKTSTAASDTLHPTLFFGVSEDLPLLIGAIIGASLVIALCLVILVFWKCCSGITVLHKKKQYWLQPKDSSLNRKYKVPVVQSNSVVFLGIKRAKGFEYKKETSSENCLVTKFIHSSNEAFHSTPLDCSLNCSMSVPFPEIVVSVARNQGSESPVFFERTDSSNSGNQTCSVISVSPVINKTHSSSSNVISLNGNIPGVTIHQESPGLMHRNFYSGTLDQDSLYSCESQVGSEVDLKAGRFNWSNYSLRPTSGTDGYYDIFQKANFCKKRKNRMRSDIAAAIALNRSQSPQSNKDTNLLVENAVEVVLDERTTL